MEVCDDSASCLFTEFDSLLTKVASIASFSAQPEGDLLPIFVPLFNPLATSKARGCSSILSSELSVGGCGSSPSPPPVALRPPGLLLSRRSVAPGSLGLERFTTPCTAFSVNSFFHSAILNKWKLMIKIYLLIVLYNIQYDIRVHDCYKKGKL